jgi:hypothetical protein
MRENASSTRPTNKPNYNLQEKILTEAKGHGTKGAPEFDFILPSIFDASTFPRYVQDTSEIRPEECRNPAETLKSLLQMIF